MPAAMVETMSLGMPIGSARMAAVAIEEPPEPPSEKMASSRLSACSLRARDAAPRAIASMARPRSLLSRSSLSDVPAAEATVSAGKSAAGPAGSPMPVSINSVPQPVSSIKR